MQQNILPQKFQELVNKVFGTLMVASGIVALVWILAILLVAVIEK
jgi:hypothetical protein